MIISICNPKWWTGKTTFAINLSVLLSEHGRRNCIIDADKVSHATNRVSSRPKSLKKVNVVGIDEHDFIANIRKHEEEYGVAIIDAPPHLEYINSMIMEISDLVIIPYMNNHSNLLILDDFLNWINLNELADKSKICAVRIYEEKNESDKHFKELFSKYQIAIKTRMKYDEVHQFLFKNWKCLADYRTDFWEIKELLFYMKD